MQRKRLFIMSSAGLTFPAKYDEKLSLRTPLMLIHLNACTPRRVAFPIILSNPSEPHPHNRMYTSRHGSRHSLAPSQLLIHSTPIPVHSGLNSILRFSSSIAAPASTAAVSLTAVAMNEACSDVELSEYLELCRAGGSKGDDRCRGSNQLLCMSKKQWSDQ